MKSAVIASILLVVVTPVWAGMFLDDFNDGDLAGWQLPLPAFGAKITNMNGELVLEGIINAVAVLDGVRSRDYQAEVSMKIARLTWAGDANGPSIGLRSQQFPLGYQFMIGANPNGEIGAIALKIVPLENRLLKFALIEIDKFKLNTWYRLKVIAKGNQFQFFIDGKKVMTVRDTTFFEGKIYLSSGFHNIVHFDDVAIQFDDIRPVRRHGKMAITWGEIKRNGR